MEIDERISDRVTHRDKSFFGLGGYGLRSVKIPPQPNRWPFYETFFPEKT